MASPPAGDLLRREPDPADRRSAGADSGRGPAGALRLRVQAQRHRQSLHLPRRHLAQGQGHRATCAADFSQCMRELSDVHFPKPKRSGSSCSTHSPASLYNALPAPEARRILRRLEFHFTPKCASWLNMVEIEIGVLARPMPRPKDLQSRHPRSRDRRLGATAQRQRRAHQMDVHDGESQTQTESRLSEAPSTDRRSAQRVITSVSNH